MEVIVVTSIDCYLAVQYVAVLGGSIGVLCMISIVVVTSQWYGVGRCCGGEQRGGLSSGELLCSFVAVIQYIESCTGCPSTSVRMSKWHTCYRLIV